MDDRHDYHVTVIWTGNPGPGTVAYNAYSRAFELACHKLWFLHLAAIDGVVVTAYVDHAEGIMRTTPGVETGHFELVTLHPEVTLAPGSDATVVPALHEEAHRRCFIANSVNFPVRCEPTTRFEAPHPEELAQTYGH